MEEVSGTTHLKDPWLVAAWPGMGSVAISAGYYLMAKLGMHQVAEFSARELFDIEHVEVADGLIQGGSLPRSRFFVWQDPNKNHDIVVFIGEAQPPSRTNDFCLRLIDFAKRLGVERVITFAAMATEMHPEHDARVFGVATDTETLEDLKRLEVEILKEGRIGGLNGVLLAVAAESGLRGACLLGEMPHIFSQVPFPKASLAVLDAFATMANIKIDLKEIEEQAVAVEQQLGKLLSQVEDAIRGRQGASGPSGGGAGPESEPASGRAPDSADKQRIEALFQASEQDRSRAYELKQLLDTLGVFKKYEDRFLGLFKPPEAGGQE